MDNHLTMFFFICITATALAMPSEPRFREKRDVMDSVKNAWGEVAQTFSNAGDAVIHVFKRTEKSTVDKMADSVANVFKPTEKSTLDKMAEGIKSLAQ